MKRLKVNPIQAAAHMFGSGGFENGYFSLFGEQRNVHFNGGGGGGTEDKPDPAKEALLVQIRGLFTKELEARKFANGEEVTAAISKHLEGLNLEALRAFDQSKIDEKIRNIAAEVEKQSRNGTAGEKRNAFKELLEKKMDDVAVVARSFGSDKTEFKMNVRAAAVMTTINAVTGEEEIPDDILNSFTLGEFVEKRRGRQFIWDLVSRSTVSELTEHKTWLEEGNEQGAFAIVAEGGLKPLVSQDVVRNFAKTKKVAAKYIITEEFMKFRKNIWTIIQRLIRQKITRDYAQLITADLVAVSVGYTGTILDGTITNPNDYHAIGAVIAQEQSLNFQPDLLVIHPQDEWRIRLQTDADGRFLYPVVTQNGETTMLGLTVVTSTYQTVGSFTVAESGLFEVEEEAITIRMGYGINFTTAGGNVTSVESDFDHNRMRMIVEMFFRDYLATPYIGSVVTANFNSVKTALETA